MRSLLLLITVLLSAMVSCAGDAIPDPAPDDLVLRVETSGGCAQIGPNCLVYDVYGDGTVIAHRVGAEPSVDVGSIDRQLVVALHREVSTTDLGALHARLPDGECRGCVDGIDTAMSFPFTVGVAAVMPIAFSSADVELDRSEPVFKAAWVVYEAAQETVEAPTVTR